MKKLLGLFGLVFLAGCITQSSHIVTGTPRTPLPADAVKVYSESPANSLQVGLVSARCPYPWQSGMDKAVDALKKQAGQIGANGIILDHSFFDAQSANATAKAVFVP